jgi:hypothetical protein
MMRLFLLMFLAAACGDSSIESIVCPANYTLVPRNATYVDQAFCVARFEMKNDGNNRAVSRATGQPWVSINRTNAIAQCRALGDDYDLISNAQWQTIARNIETQSANWSSGTVGTGFISEGHSDNNPAVTLAVTDESDPFSGTGQNSGDQKRNHVLSNGQIIWDFSGNVWEWVKDDNATNYGNDGFISLVSNFTNPNSGTLDDGVSRTLKNQFGPSGDYSSLGSTPYGHLGRAFVAVVGGGIVRGGSYIDYITDAATDEEAGIFSVRTQYAINATSAQLGYRCVYAPQNL